MAILNSLISQFKKKAPGQEKAIGGISLPEARKETGQVGPIMDAVNQFNQGSQLPEQNAEAEELRTGRRKIRAGAEGLSQRRIGSRNSTFRGF